MTVAALLSERTECNARFFGGESDRLARLCHLMAERFARDGRLIAFGRSPMARSDARHVAVEFVPGSVDRPKMLADLQKMVTAATQLMGDVPYKHYTFLMVGRGNGGIEHLNSSSDFFKGEGAVQQATDKLVGR